MEDTEIIRLFRDRDELAVRKTEKKYGALCYHIAHNILNNTEDARECVNDTLLALWNQIPPDSPEFLRAYLCRIVRSAALNRLRDSHAAKRDISRTVPLDEFTDSLASGTDVSREIETRELTRAIEDFLRTLPGEKRIMFVKRYWFCESVKSIAEEFGIGSKQASVKLGRIRKELIRYLEKEELL